MRYLRLLAVQLRASALLAIQYRGDFLVDGPISLLWAGTSLAPLYVAYKDPSTVVAGWSFGEALLVTGWFLFLTGVLEGAINPSLISVVDHIRKGTLDFVLLKPADAQFLVSTSRFEPWRATHVMTAIGVFAYGFVTLHRWPTVTGIATALLLLVSSTLLLYSLWILTVSAAFYVVKVDNLTYLFNSIFDLARWPSSFFQGVLRFIFTAVVPLALMTTFPAEAMLERLHPSSLFYAVGGSFVFAFAARFVWTRSIGHYTSASS